MCLKRDFFSLAWFPHAKDAFHNAEQCCGITPLVEILRALSFPLLIAESVLWSSASIACLNRTKQDSYWAVIGMGRLDQGAPANSHQPQNPSTSLVGKSYSCCGETVPQALTALAVREKFCAVAWKEKREIGCGVLWCISHLGALAVTSACLRQNRGGEGFEQKGCQTGSLISALTVPEEQLVLC